MCRSDAQNSKSENMLSTNFTMSPFSSFSGSFSVSICLNFSRSLIILCILPTLRPIVSTYFLFGASSGIVFSSCFSGSITRVRGVLRSWEIFVKKSILAFVSS